MDFRSDHWSLYVSGLPDVSLVHGLLLIRHLLDSPEVVESDAEPFFNDLEDVYTREMFCRFALVAEGGYGPYRHAYIAASAPGTEWGPRASPGPTRWPFPMAGIRPPYYLTKYHFLLGSFTNLYIWRLETCPAPRYRLH